VCVCVCVCVQVCSGPPVFVSLIVSCVCVCVFRSAFKRPGLVVRDSVRQHLNGSHLLRGPLDGSMVCESLDESLTRVHDPNPRSMVCESLDESLTRVQNKVSSVAQDKDKPRVVVDSCALDNTLKVKLFGGQTGCDDE